MKERQRWSAEEDALLCAYVKQYGPREWHLVSQRMNTLLHRDAKSCLERWKNYLIPGIKKGSLTDEEQSLVIRLQSKHGNKWKRIAAEVPGRTPKRLGKWWEVYKEKQQRENKDNNINKAIDPVEQRKYDSILENFAEKLVKGRAAVAPAPAPAELLMATSNGGFLHGDHPPPVPPLPPWLSTSNISTSTARPPSPSVTLSLSSSTVNASAPIPWLSPERGPDNASLTLSSLPSSADSMLISELVECCRDLEEGHRAWAAHKKEAAWRLKRVELQLESEKSCRRREKMEEIEAKVQALREEQKACLERIEGEYREQLAGLRRDADAKEQKLAEQWATQHARLRQFLDQKVCRPRVAKPNGH